MLTRSPRRPILAPQSHHELCTRLVPPVVTNHAPPWQWSWKESPDVARQYYLSRPISSDAQLPYSTSVPPETLTADPPLTPPHREGDTVAGVFPHAGIDR
jgi:hypothetical protein